MNYYANEMGHCHDHHPCYWIGGDDFQLPLLLLTTSSQLVTPTPIANGVVVDGSGGG